MSKQRPRKASAGHAAAKGQAAAAGVDATSALVAAGVGMAVGGPVGALAGAAIAPAVKLGLEAAWDYMQNRQSVRVGQVIAIAADAAGISAAQLRDRLQSKPELEELFMRTIRAAANSAVEDEIVALAKALVVGATSDDPAQIEFESIFVDVVASLDFPHLELLKRFGWTPAQLKLGDDDHPVNSLNIGQIKMVLPDYDAMVESLPATLESRGLLVSSRVSTLGGGQGEPTWKLTPFGQRVLNRLFDVGNVVA